MIPENLHEQLEHYRNELEKLIKAGKIPKDFDPSDLALFCLIHNAGFDPLKRLSEKESFLRSLYLARELSCLKPDVEKL